MVVLATDAAEQATAFLPLSWILKSNLHTLVPKQRHKCHNTAVPLNLYAVNLDTIADVFQMAS